METLNNPYGLATLISRFICVKGFEPLSQSVEGEMVNRKKCIKNPLLPSTNFSQRHTFSTKAMIAGMHLHSFGLR